MDSMAIIEEKKIDEDNGYIKRLKKAKTMVRLAKIRG